MATESNREQALLAIADVVAEFESGTTGMGGSRAIQEIRIILTSQGYDPTDFADQYEQDPLSLAGVLYDPERHDPDSVFFDDSYTGPSERELMGGCNRCGGLDDCYCVY